MATSEVTHGIAVDMAEQAIRSAVTSDWAAAHNADHLKAIAKAAYDAVVYAHGLGSEEKPLALTHGADEAVAADGKTVKCLVCGFTGKMLRRHLRTSHGLEPNDYFRLVGSRVPLTAPAYAAKRSEVAKVIGLGKGPKRRVVKAA